MSALRTSWTAREIAQQVHTLPQALAALDRGASAAARAVASFVADPAARIVLSGAGSSAFVGGILAPLLRSDVAARVDAIPTTDIVAAPLAFLEADVRTLIVSFARSGNSPESAAAIALANQVVARVEHLCITCNAAGELARIGANGRGHHLVLLPEATHDRSFAMTSSFSALLLAGHALLGGLEAAAQRMDRIVGLIKQVLGFGGMLADELGATAFSRVVYLGSGPLTALAQEAALKLLELSNGQSVAVHDSPLGFRHGPKSIVNSDTLVVMFLSADRYTRHYDLDLLAELRRDGRARRVVAIGATAAEFDDGDRVGLTTDSTTTDAQLVYPYLAFAQRFALAASLRCGLTPDNPCPAGHVNRVVQGVRIHPFAGAS